MNLQLENKVFLVSGGARGIGQAICKAIAAEGGIPVVIDPAITEANALIAELREAGQAALHLPLRLDTQDKCAQAVNTALEKLGRIDGIVNNAGRNDGAGLTEGSPEAFARSIAENLFHCFDLVHYALPALKETKGAIVNIASKTAVTGQGGTSGYAAAKGALLALTREWAVELLSHGIRVNAVVPAEVMTPAYENWLQTLQEPDETLTHIKARIPLGQRMTEPQEIASMVAFLLSARAGHTTGQHLFVDGGYVHLDRALGTILKSER